MASPNVRPSGAKKFTTELSMSEGFGFFMSRRTAKGVPADTVEGKNVRDSRGAPRVASEATLDTPLAAPVAVTTKKLADVEALVPKTVTEYEQLTSAGSVLARSST